MFAGAALSSAIVLLAFASHTNAHGHLDEPKATFQDGKSTVSWVVQIDNFWDIGSGGDQVGKFKTMAKQKGKSVKDVVLEMVGADKKCGFTRADADPQPVPTDGKAKWLGNDGGGFTHTGPCELYIDDKMVLHSDDCESDYPGGPNDSGKMSVLPVDYSSCNGKCMFKIYWLGFQNAQWQAYINCVPLSGSGGSSTTTQTQSSAGSSTGTKSTESSSTGTETTPSTETQSSASSAAQMPTTQSSATGSGTTASSSAETPSTPAPAATTQAESPSTAAPSTPSTGSDTKCTAPARRLRKKTN
ncbi:hypothetical protein PHYPSEUDO_002351 [Phytophthora pseudosyringae]|uniref:Uncharacterized protein n=1 Tax=Phytophthora pseudosyringae TaxID=221518 RepID=A0A8T1VUS2_9STRA|nr:hypothetical protein PHYPSEUDO_002351 [Phytophthora pseudosyringae]